MICRRILYRLFILLLVTGIPACGGKKQEEGDVVVRLGYLQNDLHHLPAFTALEKGFFRQKELNVRVAGVFRAGPEAMSAFSAGELDMAYVGFAPVMASVLNRTADVKIVSLVNFGGSAVVVKGDSGIDTVSGLQGKTVAVPGHATMQDFLMRTAIAHSGLDADALRIMVLKPPEMGQALQQGSIDAFIAWEPYPALAVEKTDARILISSDDIWQGHPCCVLVVSSELIKKHPEAVKKIEAVHSLSCQYIMKNPDEAVSIGMKYTGMDKTVVSAAIRNIHYHTEIDRASAERFADFLKTARYIREDYTPDRIQAIFYED